MYTNISCVLYAGVRRPLGGHAGPRLGAGSGGSKIYNGIGSIVIYIYIYIYLYLKHIIYSNIYNNIMYM